MRHFLFSLILAVAAFPAPQQAVADPGRALEVPTVGSPSGKVGRLACVSGKVSLSGSGMAWSDATVNFPIAAGSEVRTDRQSRAVIEIGADSIDLSSATVLRIAVLDDQSMGFVLPQGRITLILPQHRGGDVEIDLAQGEVWLQQPGAYDLDTGSAGHSPGVTVWSGGSRLYIGGAEIGVMPGEAVQLSAASPFVAAIAPSVTDDIAEARRADVVKATNRNVTFVGSFDMTGIAALAEAGSWQHMNSLGEVWLPSGQPDNWVPYREGSWRWIPPWGWTWIDREPWGFAPFHYGRWVLYGRSWAWVPGFAANPVYIPAAVAFLGTAGIGISYADSRGPAIGWFPLAPGEAYWPSYTDDLDYVRVVNRGSVIGLDGLRLEPDGRAPVEVVNRPFANRLAATVVPRTVFVGGHPVRPAVLDIPEERLRDAPIVMGSPRIGPPSPSTPPRPVPVLARTELPYAQRAAGGGKRASWTKAVHLATIRPRLFVQTVRVHHLVLLTLHASASAERLQHLAVYRPVHHQINHKDGAVR